MRNNMELVCKLSEEYSLRDIYNIDETGLFWKLMPDRTLSTEARSGGKKSKDCMTLAFTCNSLREKEEVWIIGRLKNL